MVGRKVLVLGVGGVGGWWWLVVLVVVIVEMAICGGGDACIGLVAMMWVVVRVEMVMWSGRRLVGRERRGGDVCGR